MGWIYGRDQSTRLSDHRFSGKRQDLFPELYPAAGLLSDRWKNTADINKLCNAS